MAVNQVTQKNPRHATTPPVDRGSADPVTGVTPVSPDYALSKSGPGNWGVAARWVVFALLIVGFLACLKIFF